MDYQNMVPGMMNGAMLGPGIMPPGLMMGDLPFPVRLYPFTLNG